MKITIGNVTFSEIIGNELENKMKVECAGYDTEYVSMPRSFSFLEMVENYQCK
jgi:hypothetical protein